MRRHRAAIGLAAALLLRGFPRAGETASLPDGSGEMVTRTAGGVVFRHRVFFRDGWVRTESLGSGAVIVSLLDTRRKHLWVIFPPPGGCIHQPYRDDPRSPQPWMTVPAEEEFLGEEEVAGRATRKFRRVATSGGRRWTWYEWRSDAARGLPIRMADPEGRYEVLLDPVVLGRPDASLFRLPRNCRAGSVLGR